MWENVIGRHIRRINRNLILTACVALGAVAVLAIPYQRYWRNFFDGPMDATPQVLSTIHDPDAIDRYYVRVSGVDAVDSGIQDITQEVDQTTGKVTSETVKGTYFYVHIGERFLLVESPLAAAQKEYIGPLVAVPENLRNQIAEELKKDNRTWSELFLPFMLDASDFTSWGYGALITAALLIAFAVFLALKALRRTSDPASSPIAKSLSRYGDQPEVVAANIDAEVVSSGYQPDQGSLTVSQSWILKREAFDLKVMNMNDLLWMYQKVLTRRLYGIVPISETRSVVLCDLHRSEISHQTSEEFVTKLLGEIAERAPWVVVGYTAEIDQMYKKNFHDFVKAVNQRKTQTA